MSRRLTEGHWHKISSSQEHKMILQSGKPNPNSDDLMRNRPRVQHGDFVGPGYYLELTYHQPCPRGCCEDFVRDLIPAKNVIVEVKEEILELAAILRQAREN